MWSVKKYHTIIVICLQLSSFSYLSLYLELYHLHSRVLQFSREKRLKADFTDVNVELCHKLCHKCSDLQKRRLLLWLLWCHEPLVNPKWNISVFSIWCGSTAQSKQSLRPKFHFGKISTLVNIKLHETNIKYFFSLVKSNKKFALLFGKEKPEKCFPCRWGQVEFYWWSVLCLKALHVDEIPHSMYFIKAGECKSNWPWFKEPLSHSIL